MKYSGLDVRALDPIIIVMEAFCWFGNKTGSLLELGGIDIKLDEFLTANGALNCAFVLLS